MEMNLPASQQLMARFLIPTLYLLRIKTLPMPSVVRVTNLDNGKSLVVRINDRGPFVAGRIIDLSREAARLMGYKDKGIARVRVQILPEETLRLEKLGKAGQFPLLNEGDEAPKAGGNSRQTAICQADGTHNAFNRNPSGIRPVIR